MTEEIMGDMQDPKNQGWWGCQQPRLSTLWELPERSKRGGCCLAARQSGL